MHPGLQGSYLPAACFARIELLARQRAGTIARMIDAIEALLQGLERRLDRVPEQARNL
jgi:hypothetical protein